MKILYVTTISNTVNSFLIPHIKFLIEHGNVVDVAFQSVQEVHADLMNLGCKIHPVDFQRNPFKRENIHAYKKIKKIVSEEGYELVHVHTPVAAFVTRLACRKLRHVKILYTAHGFHFFKGAPKKNWALFFPLEKIAARWTDGLITMNDEDFSSAKKLKLRARDSIFKVHGVGVDLRKFFPETAKKKVELRNKYHFSSNDFILIYVGELSYRKHQDLLIKAVSLLKDKIPNMKLLLAGDGDLLDEYKRMVKQLRVENNIAFLGYRHDINNLMVIADLAISTSRQEGLPVNILEAMAAGLPLIVTNCRGNRDLVNNGENGIVIGVDDVDACVNAIEKLYHSKELMRKYANKNRELIGAYSVEDVLSEMRVVYSKLFKHNQEFILHEKKNKMIK